MEVTISQFRREMFHLVKQAMDGGEVWVTHKGRRFKIAPDPAPSSRLARITPLEVTNPESPGSSNAELDTAVKEEMVRAWERDWSTL